MPRIVSISSLKGGVGKTSITLGLASAALHGGLKTLVIDLDPHADASTGLDVAPTTPDIASIMDGDDEDAFTASVGPSGWNRHAGATTLLTSHPATTGEIQVARGSARSILFDTRQHVSYSERVRKLIRATDATYDLVLIDCPPFMGTLTSVGWAASQRILSIAEPSLFSVAGTERTLRGIARFKDNNEQDIEGVAVGCALTTLSTCTAAKKCVPSSVVSWLSQPCGKAQRCNEPKARLFLSITGPMRKPWTRQPVSPACSRGLSPPCSRWI